MISNSGCLAKETYRDFCYHCFVHVIKKKMNFMKTVESEHFT